MGTYKNIEDAIKARQRAEEDLYGAFLEKVVAAKGMKPRMVATMGKDKTEQIKNAIVDIYNHNNNCIIGYNNEAIAKYKALSK